VIPARWQSVTTSQSLSSTARATAWCVILLGNGGVFPALFLASRLRLAPRCLAFFLALCPRKRGRETPCGTAWRSSCAQRSIAMRFRTSRCRKQCCELGVRIAANPSSLNLRVDEFQFPDGKLILAWCRCVMCIEDGPSAALPDQVRSGEPGLTKIGCKVTSQTYDV
jgi:hypothetical protein